MLTRLAIMTVPPVAEDAAAGLVLYRGAEQGYQDS